MVRVGPDSVSFVQGVRDQISIPADRFSNASYTNRWKGLGFGAVIGGFFGGILSAAAASSGGDYIDLGNGPLIFGAILGGMVGGGRGLIQGYPTTVIRDSPEQRRGLPCWLRVDPPPVGGSWIGWGRRSAIELCAKARWTAVGLRRFVRESSSAQVSLR